MKKIDVSTPKYPNTVVLVDDEDFVYLSQWRWSAVKMHNTMYANRCIKNNGRWVPVKIHRVILDVPKGMVCDHKDGSGLNNQRSNLRICRSFQNTRNMSLPSNSTSGYKGVSWYARKNKWRACICPNNKTIHLGYFKAKEDAAMAYDKKAKELYGEFARLNFPELSGVEI